MRDENRMNSTLNKSFIRFVNVNVNCVMSLLALRISREIRNTVSLNTVGVVYGRVHTFSETVRYRDAADRYGRERTMPDFDFPPRSDAGLP